MENFLDRIASLDKPKLALLADRLQKNLEAEVARRQAPIAVTSMACRFPSAPGLDEYWDLLQMGRTISEPIPPSRWRVAEYFDARMGEPGKMYCDRGAFLEGIDHFDASHFGISTQEARRMDPQQRLLLEVAWQAIENAGLASRIQSTRTGVFAGISQSTYAGGMSIGRPKDIDVYSGAGNMCATAVGRLSHVFGLRGPCMPVDTACSSSLVALHLAVQSLRRGECDLALVAGINLMLAPEMSIYFCRLGLLSPSGRCRSFSAHADGYVRGEGCGVVLLQRLSDAQQNGSPIVAVIRGTAVNHDGRGSGLTVPHGKAQVEVMRQALADANLKPDDIDYLEGQGTATPLGDSIELQSVLKCYAVSRQTPLWLGSVKSNIGHLETASGMAALIKSCLCLRHRVHVPHPDANDPAEIIRHEPKIQLCQGSNAWSTQRPTRIGINAFGISGTNAHVILEEPPAFNPTPDAPGVVQGCGCDNVLLLSAHSPRSLAELAAAACETLQADPSISWSDFCFTGNHRAPREYRRSILASDRDSGIAALQQFSQQFSQPAPAASPIKKLPRIAIVLGDRCNSRLATTARDLAQALPPSSVRELEFAPAIDSNSSPVQPWLACQASQAYRRWLAVWEHWGLQIDAVVGCGLQELTAGCMSGVLVWNEVNSCLKLDDDGDYRQFEAALEKLTRAGSATKGWLSSSDGRWIGNSTGDVTPLLERIADRRFNRSAQPLSIQTCQDRLSDFDTVILLGDIEGRVPEPWLHFMHESASETGQELGQELGQWIGQLFEQGVNWDWHKIAPSKSSRWVAFPNTQFQRQRFWIDRPDVTPSFYSEHLDAAEQGQDWQRQWREIYFADSELEAKRTQALDFFKQWMANFVTVPIDSLSLDTQLDTLGLESLAAAEIHYALWNLTGVRVPLDWMLQPRSVQDLIDYVLSSNSDEWTQRTPIVRHPDISSYAPTSAQTRYWFYHHIVPTSPVYNNVLAVKLRGEIDDTSLVACLNNLVGQHDVLRTRFIDAGGKPLAVIADEVSAEVDLQSFTDEAARDQWAIDFARRSFRLEHCPLWRVGLGRLVNHQKETPVDRLLIISAHHIILDGWSLAMLIERIFVGWLGRSAERAADNSQHIFQFSDFAIWSNELALTESPTAVDFWRQALSGTNPVLNIPTDHPRRLSTGQGKLRVMSIDAELVVGVKRLASERGTTMFSVMLSAFAAVLNRYSSQSTFNVGVPAAGRAASEFRDVLGMFMNTLAIPFDFVGVERWNDALQRTIDTVRQALEHQDVPFTTVVDAVEVTRDPMFSPLFQVLFAFQNFPIAAPVTTERLEWEPCMVDPGVATFDLTLMMAFWNGEAHCGWQYRTDLLDESTIVRLHEMFCAALQCLVADPQALFGSQQLVAQPERTALIELGTSPRSLVPKVRLESFFEETAQEHPARTAVFFKDQSITFGQLQRDADRVSQHLQALGIGPGARVGLAVGRTPRLFSGMLGILKAGAAYVPLDIHYPPERLCSIISDAQLAMVITEDESASRFPECSVERLSIDDLVRARHQAEPLQDLAGERSGERSGEQLAYVLYTSGSTGNPKGVMIPHRVAVNRIETEMFPLQPHEVFCVQTSINFVDSIWEIFSAWRIGQPVLLLPYAPATELAQWLALLRKFRVTRILMVPSLLRTLLEGEYNLAQHVPTLERVICTGESLPSDLLEKCQARAPGIRLVNLYGTTETWDVSQWVADRTGVASAPIGKPMPNVSTYVLDSQLTLAARRAVGELYVGGAGLSLGYWKNRSLTATKFLPDPWSPLPGARMYRTGDLVRWLSDGNLEFNGRIDHQLSVRGYRVEAGEVESILREFEAVRNAAVKLDAQGRLIAYCEPVQGATISIEALRKSLKQRLPEAAVPGYFVVLDRLPLTPTGKISRRSLPDIGQSRPEIEQAFLAPRTTTEQRLAEVWCAVLNLQSIGIHDDFFLLGGHSLLATQMISKVRQLFHVELPLNVVFDTPNIAELAKWLDSGQGHRSLAPIQPVADRLEAPLSYSQSRLWVLSQLQPDNSIYNLCGAIRIVGHLDVQALHLALQALVDRQSALRTTFALSNSGPVQRIQTSLTVELGQVQLAHLPGNQPAIELQQAILHESNQPFDFENGPLIRCKLIQVNPSEHVFLLSLHHIIADGWSISVLVKELGHFYECFKANLPPALPALQIQYADYCSWQRENLQSEEVHEQLKWWLAQLDGIPDSVLLPTDYPKPAVSQFRGARARATLSVQLTDAINQFSDEHGSTLYMTLSMAWQILIARLSGQAKFSIGSPIANRQHAETEPLIGLFVNLLVVPADFSDDPQVSDYLQRHRKFVLEAFARQDVPFERLVEAINPSRDVTRTPLFQTVFVLQNAPLPKLQMPDGLSLEAMEFDVEKCRFDLEMHCWEHAGRIHMRLIYDAELFRSETIDEWLEYYQFLLQQIIDRPSCSVSQLQLLSTEHQSELLRLRNPSPQFTQVRLLHELFEEQVQKTPHATAIVCGDEKITYQALNRRANLVAGDLSTRGVAARSFVAVFMERSIDMIATLLGVLKAGCAYVPLDPAYPRDRLRLILNESQPRAVCTSPGLLNDVPEAQQQLLVIEFPTTEVDAAKDEAERTDDHRTVHDRFKPLASSVASPDDLAYVIYTSGSTGQPKGVEIRHAAVVELIQWAREAIGPEVYQQALVTTSISFDYFTLELYPALATGGTAYLVENAFIEQSMPGFDQLTLLSTVPSAIKELVRQKAIPPNLRALHLAGEPLTSGLVEEVRSACRVPIIRDIYGPSEDTTCSTSAVRTPNGAATIGRPIRNTRGYVLSPSMHLQPALVTGQLYLAGAGLARGYLRRARETAQRFVPDLFSPLPGARMYRTGDKVSTDRTGDLFFLGRDDGQIKLRGIRIEYEEIEFVLNQHPTVRQSAVYLHAHPTIGPQLVALVVTVHPSKPLDTENLLTHLRKNLPEVMVPSQLLTVSELPRTSSGKLDRQALPSLGEASVQTVKSARVEPRNQQEQELTELWQKSLGNSSIGIFDNFFDLGGHSLLAVEIAHELRKRWQLNCSLAELLREPTIASIASKLVPIGHAQSIEASGNNLKPLNARSRGWLSSEQRMIWTLQMLSPSSPTMNVPIAFRIPKRIRPVELQRAAMRLLDRHPMLRCRFESTREGVRQTVGPPSIDVRYSVLLPCASSSSQIHPNNRQELNAFAAEPFMLKVAPLLRILLLESPAGIEESVVCIVSHHLVMDGWSALVMLEDLFSLYREEVRALDEDAECMELVEPEYSRLRFIDWVARENGPAEITAAHSQCASMLARLADANLGVKFPIARTTAPEPSSSKSRFEGQRLNLPLDTEIVGRVERYAAEQKTSEHCIYLAAFQVLLARMAGSRKFTVGGVLADRDDPDTHRLIGNLSRTIVFLADLDDRPKFSQVVQRVHDDLLWNLEHRQVHFEMLARELVKRNANVASNPVFDVMFTYQRVPKVDRLAELDWVEVETGTSRIATTLSVIHSSHGVLCSWEFRSAWYEAVDIQQFQELYRNLLDQLLAHPSQDSFQLPLVVEQSAAAVSALHGARRSTSYTTLNPWIRSQVEARPEQVAIRGEKHQLTYFELQRCADATAGLLIQEVDQDASVGVEMRPSAEALIIVLACLQAGLRCVALSSSHPHHRQATFMEQLNIQRVFTDQPRSPDRRFTVISSLDSLNELLATHSSTLTQGIDPDRARRGSFVFQTSGSSGTPKTILVDQQRLVNRVATEFEPWLSREVSCWKCQLGIVDSLWEMFAGLCQGHSLLIPTTTAENNPQQFIATLHKTGVTRYIFTPTLLRLLFSHDPQLPLKLKALKCWYIGGEPLPLDLVEQFLNVAPADAHLVNGYGISEVWDVTACRVKRDYRFGCVGTPWDNVDVYVLDDALNLQPIGVPGEIHVGGSGLAIGYWGQQRLTATSFLPDPFSPIPGSRIYRTGDLGQIQRDGQLYHLGRCDQQINLRGQRIEPEGIEAVLRKHPKVIDAAVVIARLGRTERLVAYVQVGQDVADHASLQSELRIWAAAGLPASHVPAQVILQLELPRTISGKVQRRELSQRDLPPVSSIDDPPRTELETEIQKIWEEQLGVRVGIHQNYFEAGGDSLHALQMLNTLRAQCRIECSLEEFFASPTIVHVAMHAGAQSTAEPTIAFPRDADILASQSSRRGFGLLPNQEQLWAIHELTSGMVPVNHLYIAFKFRGPLDLDSLHSACQHVISQHEALRLCFRSAEGRLVQVVDDQPTTSFQWQDLTHQPERDAYSLQVLTRAVVSAFDLHAGPPWRLIVNRLGDEEYDVAWVVHHLVADGWSMSLLTHQLFMAYLQMASGMTLGTSAAPRGFLDYVQWYQRADTQARCKEQLSFWQRTLKPAATTRIAPDQSVDQFSAFSGAAVQIRFESDLTFGLKRLAQQQGGTLFAVLMATLHATVSRMTQSPTNTILTAAANRVLAEFEPIVGFFVNVVPIQISIDPTTTFDDLLRAVRRSTIQAFANSLVDFDAVCRVATPNAKGTLPSEIMLVLQSFPETSTPSLAVEIEPLLLDPGTTPFDVNIALFDLEETLLGTLTYRTALYQSKTIEMFVERWKNVCRQCLENPQRSLASLDILLTEELRQIEDLGW